MKQITQAEVLQKGEREDKTTRGLSEYIYLGFSKHACVLILFSPLSEQKKGFELELTCSVNK